LRESAESFQPSSGRVARSNIPKQEKVYQVTTKYTKWSQNIPTGHKIYQMTTKYTKRSQNIPNGHKIYQMATAFVCIRNNIAKIVHKIDQHFLFQGPLKYTQIVIFGLKYTIWQPFQAKAAFLRLEI
jgi:hypothetical protein